ncbi:aminopeptidase n [hydrocarbon metagenome]|uniref:Aminopeptidase n n=1 Tax=hydrocarbon metagenome TaxID=938273 RepID=A0A0W8E4Q8_9ZZZZ
MIKKFYIATALVILISAICLAIPFHDSLGKENLGLSPLDDEHTLLSADEYTGEVYSFPAPDKTRYEMEVYLDIVSNLLYGRSRVCTINTTGQVMNDLWLTVYPNAFSNPNSTPAPAQAYYKGFNPGWLELDRVMVNGQEVECYLDGVSMHIVMTFDIIPDKDIIIDMNWRIRIPEIAYRFGSKDGIFMLGNFYPVLNVYDQAGWHIAYNSKFGDPFCFHCADYRVRVNIPDAYQLVSTGSTVYRNAEDTGRTIYLIEASRARDFCLLIIYDYQEIKSQVDNVTVKCYVPGGSNLDKTREIAAQCGEMLHYYSSRWGSYPYLEFKIALVPMQGFHGMEYTGLIFLKQELLSAQFDSNRGSFILAHEVAHQWWYAMVGNDQLAEPWLDEALANWSAYEYQKHAQGMSAKPKSTTVISKLDQQLNEIDSNSEYYKTIYDGGEAFWAALEEELGRDTIDSVLRRYLADYKYDIATTQGLLDTIRKEARQDMDSFLDEWF